MDCKHCPGEIELENGRWFHTRIEDGSHVAEPKEPADFENGLAKIKHHATVHYISPNPMTFDVLCGMHRSSRTSDDLRPANDATDADCGACLRKKAADDRKIPY